MDDIADAAELAKGTLYYYFKSKDEIFLQLLERESRKVDDEIRRRITASSSFLEALGQTIAFYLEYFEKNHGFSEVVPAVHVRVHPVRRRRRHPEVDQEL